MSLWRSGFSRRRWINWLLVCLFFLALSVLFTWPLILQIGDAVVGRYGDNMHFVWMQGWYVDTLLEQGKLPYDVPILNYPEGWNLARSEIPTTLLLLGLIPAAIGSPVLGYNFAVLVSFFLSGLFAYILVRHLTGSGWAALIAGSAFAVLPFRIAHFRAGHLNVLATMWYPLILLGIIEVILRPRESSRYGLLAGLGFGLLAHSSMYACYLTLLTFGFGVVGFILIWRRNLLWERHFWKCMGWMAVVGAPLILTAAWPYFQLVGESGFGGRSVFAVTGGSASLSDFFLPSTDHFLWGSWVARTFSRDQWIEGSLYIGIAIGILALIGAIKLLRDSETRGLAFLLGSIGAVALVLALGTHLHWNEEMVRLTLPKILTKQTAPTDISIRLPAFYLYQLLPFFDRLRTFKRIAAMLLLVIPVFAGFGIVWLEGRTEKQWLMPLIFAAVLLDFYPGPFSEFNRVGPRPADRWLRQQPAPGAVVEFPFYLQTEQIHVYYTLENGKPYFGGFFSAFPPDQYQRIQPVMQGFPDEASVAEIKALGADFLLLNRGKYSELEYQRINQAAQKLGLDYAGRLGENDIFLILEVGGVNN